MSGSIPLLSTKLDIPPGRPTLIARPRLTTRLTAGWTRPLTLICAPAGFGKTTLLTQWIADELPAALSSADLSGQSGPRVAWLSLDADDNDPVHFFTYLMAALEKVNPGLCATTSAMLSAAELPALPMLATYLLHDLSALDRPLVLALDDYQVITAAPVHDALGFMLAHLPSALHLILLSREDPPLPLAKLRVRNQLLELREEDLRFSQEEVSAFLTRTMGLELSAAALASLANRTEGWIAALQIAGLSLQNRSDVESFIAAFRGDDHYVMDYLMDEVFDRQPPQIQDFLLQTSILERLNAALCDAVTAPFAPDPQPSSEDGMRSQAILEHLERVHLFLQPLDSRRVWYRYHLLFADLLRYRLRRTYPERLPELHQRAYHWYVAAGDPDEAMRHALALPDAALAADLAERYLLPLIGNSRVATYLSWMQQLPEEIIRGRAYLCAGCAWAYVLAGQPEAALRYADSGSAALAHYEPVASAPDGRWITQAEVIGSLAAIRSYAARLRNDLSGAVAYAQEALLTLPDAAGAIRCAVAFNLGLLHLDNSELEPARQAFYEAFAAAGRAGANAYVAVSALSQLGGIAAMRGKLREADSLFQRAIRFDLDEAGMIAPSPAIGIAHGWLVWLHYQRNEISAAQEHLDHLLPAAAQLAASATTARAYTYQALLAQSRGEMDAAAAWYAQAEALLRTHPAGDLISAEWAVFRGQFHLLQGDPAAAAALLAAQGLEARDLEEKPTRWLRPRLASYLLLARIQAAQGALAQAEDLLARVSALAERIPQTDVLLQALALHAALLGAPRGLPTLARALDLAAAEGFIAPFLAAGAALVNLLRQAIIQGIQPAFAQALLTAVAGQALRRAVAGQALEISKGSEAPIEPLTDRERQVLRLLAAGLSSTETAAQLVISVSTARSYIKSLYGKLAAHGRDEAIARGRQYGLL